MIAWAMHSSMDGDVDISRHTARGILPNKYTLVPGPVGGTGATSVLKSRVMFLTIIPRARRGSDSEAMRVRGIIVSVKSN